MAHQCKCRKQRGQQHSPDTATQQQLPEQTENRIMQGAWFTVLACLLLTCMPVRAQWDPSTGRIKPTPGAPSFDPLPWNGAYKLTFRSFPRSEERFKWPSMAFNVSRDCSSEGFDSTPATGLELNKCFYKRNNDGTYDWWTKLHGLAFYDANCYCYALNKFEGNYCLPGGERGWSRYSQKMTCPALHKALVDDGAKPVSRQQAMAGQPDRGHYIALMARPAYTDLPSHCRYCENDDFHFARKDSRGTWSHKIPQAPATDRDLDGNPIKDPEAALLPGHYSVCGYYEVDPTKMPTGSSPRPGPLKPMDAIELYRTSSKVGIDISPLPYDAATDGRVEARRVSGTTITDAEDLAWERKRGTKEYEEWKQKQLEALEVVPADSKKDASSMEDGIKKDNGGSSSSESGSKKDGSAQGSSVSKDSGQGKATSKGSGSRKLMLSMVGA